MDEASLRKVLAKLGIPVLGKSQGGWLQARCPLAPYTHERGTDRKPAFAAMVCDDGPSYYKCLACHYKGRMSQLVRTLEGFTGHRHTGLALECDMADANGVFGSGFDIQHQMLGYEEPEPIDESVIRGAYPTAIQSREAAAYLQRRGIGPGTAELLGLLFDPDQQRILFPVRGQQGELYGFTGRLIIPETDANPKIRDYLGLPKRSLLLGLHLYQPGKPSFVVEGLFGFASLVQQGARHIVNPLALLGSELTPPKASLLAMLDEQTYLMPDNDLAGEACLFGTYDKQTGQFDGDGAIHRLKRKGVSTFVPEWPGSKIDPDQLVYGDVETILAGCPPWMQET